MRFRRWVVFTFAIHVLVVAVDKGAGLVLYVLTRNQSEQHGKASILASLPFILMALANLGLATSLVYHIKRRKYTAQQSIETTMTVALVWGGFVALLAGLVTLFVLPLLHPDWTFDPLLVIPFCAAVPMLLIASYANSIQLALDRVREYGVVHLISSVTFLPMFLLCWWLTGSDAPMGVAWGRLLTAFLMAAVTVWMIRRLVRVRLGMNWKFLQDNLRYGWKANLTSVLTYLNHRVDLLVLAALYVADQSHDWHGQQTEKLQQVAFYSMAVTFAELVWHFPEAMRDLFFSKVAGSTHEQARQLTPILSRLGLVVSAFAALAIVLAVDPVMGALTWMLDGPGNAWQLVWSEPVGDALLLLAPGTVGFTVAKILQADLAARNQLQSCVNACALVLVVMLALDVVLIPDMGARGAAIASTAAYLLSSVYTLWVYSRNSGAGMLECLVVRRSDWVYIEEIICSVWNKLRRRKP